MSNLDNLGASFTSVDSKTGEAVVPDKDKAVFTMVVNVPSDTPDGVYKIGFGNKCEVFKDGSSFMYKTAAINGNIKVGKVDDPITTTAKPTSDSEVVLDFGSYTADPGQKINVSVMADTANQPITAADVTFKIDSPLKIVDVAKSSPAVGQPVMSNLNILGASFTSVDSKSGEGVVPDKSKAIFVLSVEIPADTAAGKYNITFGDKCEIVKDGSNAQYKTTVKNGVITVNGPTTTAKDVTTTIAKNDTTTAPKDVTTTSAKDDTPTITTKTPDVKPADGAAEWVIPAIKAAPGETVKMDVVVKDSAIEVAGAQFNITSDKISGGKGTTGNAYATVLPNDAENLYAFGQQKGQGIKAAENAVILTMTYTVPADAKEGDVYPVKWSNAFITDTNGQNITSKIKLTDGSITITSAPKTDGKTTWKLDNVKANPGDTVVINAVVDNGTGKGLEIAGAQFNIKADAPIAYVSAADGDAYSAKFAKNNDEQLFANGNNVGKGENAATGKKVISITYKVPADCKGGVYPITWSNAFITDTNGASITPNVELVNGSITVGGIDDPIQTGEIKWVIPDVTGTPGETVVMPVKVKGSDSVSVAGAQFIIKAAEPISYVSADGKPYGVSLTKNDSENIFAFANAIGAGTAAKDGDELFTLTYKVPAGTADGTYPVKWSDAFITDTNGKAITSNIKLVDGSISIGTTTTAPANVTTTSTSTTVSTSVKQEDPVTTSTNPHAPDQLDKDQIAWKAATVETEAGKTIDYTVEVYDPEGVKLPIAGGFFTMVIDSKGTGIKAVKASGDANIYGGKVVFNTETNEYAFANPKGVTVAAENGKLVLSVSVDIPAGTPAGEYNVDLGGIKIYDADGKDISAQIKDKDGAIIVKEPTTSSTTVSGVTTSTTTISGQTTSTTVSGQTTSTTVSGQTTSTTVSGQTTSTTVSGQTTSTTVSGQTTSTTVSGQTTSSTVSGQTTSTTVSGQTTSTTVSGQTTSSTVSGQTTSSTVSGQTTSTTVSGETTTSTDKPVVSTTTTASTPEVTTTTVKGAIKWVGNETTVYAGETAKITFVIEDEQKSALPIAGAQFNIDCKFTGKTDDKLTNAYGASIVANPATGEYAFANPIGAQIASVDGKVVVEIEYAVPADTEAGKYKVDIKDIKAFDGNGTDISDHVVSVDGWINVKKPDVTDTTTTTTVSGQTTTTAKDVTTTTGKDVTTTTGKDVTTTTAKDVTTTTAKDVTTTTGKDVTTTTGKDVTTTTGEDITTTTGKDVTTTTGKDVTTTTGEDITTTTGKDVTTTTGEDITTTTGKDVTTTTGENVTTTTAKDVTTTTGEDETTTTAKDVTTTTGENVTTTTAKDVTTTTGEDETTTTAKDVTTTTSENVNTTTTTDGKVLPGTATGTTTKVVLPDPPTVDLFFEVTADPGYYFSHDTGVRAKGDKGGFDKKQITKLLRHFVEQIDGKYIDTITEITLDGVNFNGNTPNKAYHDRFGTPAVNETVEASDFEYQIPVYIDDIALVDKDNKPLVMPAYIGVKGDTNLDFVVDGRDATATLSYYAKISTSAYSEDKTPISPATFIKGADDPLDDLAAFLSDVNTNEWNPDNWSYKRADTTNRVIDGTDATAILTFYARQSAQDDPKYNKMDDQQLWDTVVPNRFGTK
jgi:hypothetical protein